jgi:hypothetical protein
LPRPRRIIAWASRAIELEVRGGRAEHEWRLHEHENSAVHCVVILEVRRRRGALLREGGRLHAR